MTNIEELKNKIINLKKIKNAYIIAHNYMLPEVQDIADFVGDSLAMAQEAKKVNSNFIIVCGVYFMAETAAILNPNKNVFIPDKNAGCPLANFANPKMVIEWRKIYSDYDFVAYVNTTADVKALVDICCTSSNAIKIIKSLKNNKIVFLPDKNLGEYVKSQIPEKEIITWPGYCIVHENADLESVLEAKKSNPDALMMVHPECPKEFRDLADGICSTGQMIEFVRKNYNYNKFIVVTEWGMNYALSRNFPDKKFISPSIKLECNNMKKITLDKVYNVLNEEKNKVIVDDEIAKKAYNAIEKMLII